jgi:hypothetical protein
MYKQHVLYDSSELYVTRYPDDMHKGAYHLCHHWIECDVLVWPKLQLGSLVQKLLFGEWCHPSAHFLLVIFRVATEADKRMESCEVWGSTVLPLKKLTLPTVNCLVQDAHTLLPLQ